MLATLAQVDSGDAAAQNGSRFVQFFVRLFDTGGFPPRWECGNWPAEVGWLHIGSDIAIFLAYAAIPASLVVLILRRHDVPVRGIFWLFVAFILSCGITHLLDATMFYYPMYRLLGLMKLITACVSLTTVVALVRVLPIALALPGQARANTRAQAELLTQKEKEQRLLQVREQLEERSSQLTVRERRVGKAIHAARTAALCWDPETGEIDWQFGLDDLMLGSGARRPPVRNLHEILDEPGFEAVRLAGKAAVSERRPLLIECPMVLAGGGRGTARFRAGVDSSASESGARLIGVLDCLEVVSG